MKSSKLLSIISVIIAILVFTVACSSGQATTPPQAPVATQPSGSTTQQPVVTTAPATVPEDVPIMPDAYDVQVPNQLNVSYKAPAQIKDVVAFYQTALPTAGWDQTNNPDSVVGNMAQMSRSKANGDRITFSLQYNPVGEFTIVIIWITRTP